MLVPNDHTITGTAQNPVTVDLCKQRCCEAATTLPTGFTTGDVCLSFDWDSA